MRVYLENRHPTCKVCKITFKRRNMEEGLIIKGHQERIWKIELFCILIVAVVSQLYAFVKTHGMC